MDEPTVIDIPLHVDDRGTVYGAFDNLDKAGIKRTYVIRNWQIGTIRAWHGHKKAGTYLHVIKGAAKIAAVKIDKRNHELFDFQEDFYKIATLSAAKPQLFYVPPGWYNGTMTLTEDTRILVYSTLTLDEVKSDDIRQNLVGFERENLWKVKDR